MKLVDRDAKLPHYSDLKTYPNNRSKHQLVIFKNGLGECSCEGWTLTGASEKSAIRSHQYHVDNHDL